MTRQLATAADLHLAQRSLDRESERHFARHPYDAQAVAVQAASAKLVSRVNAQASAEGAKARSAGLVNVPTTHTPYEGRSAVEFLGSSVCAAQRKAQTEEHAKAVGAFRTDRTALRLRKMRMNVSFNARAMAVSERGHRTDRAVMVTLTYRKTTDWQPSHLGKALTAVRNWATRNFFTLRYTWVAEMQKRGAIHYHIVFWLPRSVRMPKWDLRGWWPHGMSNRVMVRRNAVGYLMKYLSKGCDMAFPKGARTYGSGGLEHALRRATRWLNLPSFVQRLSDTMDDWRRRPGGGWTSPTGEVFASEFRQVFVAGQRYIQRVLRHPGIDGFDPAGPFSWLTRSPSFGV